MKRPKPNIHRETLMRDFTAGDILRPRDERETRKIILFEPVDARVKGPLRVWRVKNLETGRETRVRESTIRERFILTSAVTRPGLQ
jgi:hypothetical protein